MKEPAAMFTAVPPCALAKPIKKNPRTFSRVLIYFIFDYFLLVSC